jgi:ABC-type multidrug transport system fused ATPase/permease subunit
LADKTGIIISHRVSSVGNADLVLVLDAGKIVQMGKRTELAHTNGKYAEMIQNQQKK